MTEKITLELTREQAYAVASATELLARLEIGQFSFIIEAMENRFMADGKFDCDRRDRAEDLLKEACKTMFGVNAYGYPDVTEKSILHERCWAVASTILYTLAWHDHPEGSTWNVDFREPLGYGEPMPRCEVTNEPE